jgi:hypothetical protein
LRAHRYASLGLVVGIVLAAVAASGCLGSRERTRFADENEKETPRWSFADPVQVNLERQEGFEPSLRISEEGVVFVAAARGFFVGGDGSAASPVWFSLDAGDTWQNLAAPLPVRERLKAIEGDLALDKDGSLFFVDTYGPDNFITKWTRDRAWQWTRPHATVNSDDRPWLAGHGSGILYYLGNGVASLPAPGGAPLDGSRIWFYRSLDGGLTWSTGHAFVEATYCHVAASPADDETVAVVCANEGGPGIGIGEQGIVAYWSTDRGTTWDSHLLSPLTAPTTGFPSIAFTPAGTAYAAWTFATAPSQSIGAAVSVDGTWTVLSAPNITGDVGPSWIAATATRVAVAAYARTAGEAWFLHAWLWDGADWMHTIVDPEPVSPGPGAPEDFFQTAFDPDGRLHIAYQRNDAAQAVAGDIKPYLQPILHVREA